MKFIFSVISFLLLFSGLSAQAPDIEWQKDIGSGATDFLYCSDKTIDGGYILGGTSGGSIFGDKTVGYFGGLDYWVVKIDSVGNIQWQNVYGGDQSDQLNVIHQTPDNGYILGGWSASGISGNKTEINKGNVDYWILKIDSLGNIEWQKDFGGEDEDKLTTLILTSDGGYLAGGYSLSCISGDKTDNCRGGYDYWILKLNSNGNIEWQKTIGGNNFDQLTSVIQTIDLGYIILGNSNSGISGDKTIPDYLRPDGIPSIDYWMVKLDSSGEIIFQSVFGGDLDDYGFSICKSVENHYYLFGESNSDISDNKSEPSFGLYDYWLVCMNDSGTILWDKTFGGSDLDYGFSIIATLDGGSILSGWSRSSISGNKLEPTNGSYDYWVIKIDSTGNVLWQKDLGGYDVEETPIAIQDQSGGYLIAGESYSDISGDKTENTWGSADFWLIKLTQDDFCTPTTFYADYDGDGYGNNAFPLLSCDTPASYVANNLDCNDLNASIHPGASELCNSIDDNCNGLVDDGIPFYSYYQDYDMDGYGNAGIDSVSCLDALAGYVADSTDCNDLDNSIHAPVTYFADMDGDMYGDSLNTITLCSLLAPAGYVGNGLDCNDDNYYVNPGSNEILNGIDDNCNGEIDEGFTSVNISSEKIFEIYPNPNSGNFIIRCDLNASKIALKIYNLEGECIFYESSCSTVNIAVNLSNANNGLYLAILLMDNQSYSGSFIIDK